MKHSKFKLAVAVIIVSFLSDGRAASSLTTESRPVQDASDLVENARNGDLRAVDSILAAGVDVNAKSKDGETALAAAAGAYKSADDVVELLLDNGAKVNERSLGHSAVWVDIGFGFHDDPMPSFRCGHSIGPMAEAYTKADKIGPAARMTLVRVLQSVDYCRRYSRLFDSSIAGLFFPSFTTQRSSQP